MKLSSANVVSAPAAKPAHRYRAFGLSIQSDLELEEFDPRPDGRSADLRIRLLDEVHVPLRAQRRFLSTSW